MKTKHTKGQWEIAPNKLVIVKNGTDDIIADCDTTDNVGGIKQPEMEANAKLIASAPELLEALIKLLKSRYKTVGEKELAEEIALQVIKKATE